MTEHRPDCTNGHSSNGFVDDETNGDIYEDEFDGRRRKSVTKLTKMDSDLISLIGQHLRESGLNKTLESLIEESGCVLEHPLAAKFRKHILRGEWSEATSTLEKLSPLLTEAKSVEKMRLLILEEKYLELLESGDRISALHCLRHDLSLLPIYHPEKRIQDLSQYVMCQSRGELLQAASWPGVSGGSRERLMDQLQAFLPATIMLPPKRLQNLLRQSLQLQVERCPFHYIEQDISSYTLLTDHMCSRNCFPSEIIHTLKEHTDEVWYLQFSHDGNKLATGCKDGHIYIWNTKVSEKPTKLHVLKAQSSGITSLKWSPDDSILLSCGAEDCPEVILYDTQTWQEKCRVTHSPEDSLTCCAWHHGGHKFYVGGLRGQFYECSVDTGIVTNTWEGVRLHAIATHPYCDIVYGADSHMRIKQYNFHDKTSTTLIKEEQPIMSISLSKDAKYALLNVASQGVHMWNIIDRCLVKRFQGVTQGFYTIHSCFGINDSFIASGSEDHHVYIWNQRRETPVIILQGHSKTVNCVSWNPVHPTLIASASDDGTVVLWGTEEEMKRQRELEKLEQEQNKNESTQEETSQICENGLSSTRSERDRAESEYNEEIYDEDDDEFVDTREGESRYMSESDLQSLEMLEPESSSHDDSLDSIEQLDAAVSLSVLSVGLSAVREQSQRRLVESSSSVAAGEPSNSTGHVLVVMPTLPSHYRSVEQEDNDEEVSGVLVDSHSITQAAVLDQSTSELQSRSFDLDSSIDSTGSSTRQMELTERSSDNVTSMSVITSVSRNIRTSNDSVRQISEEVAPSLEAANGSTTNGSSTETTTAATGTSDSGSVNDSQQHTNSSSRSTGSSISTIV